MEQYGGGDAAAEQVLEADGDGDDGWVAPPAEGALGRGDGDGGGGGGHRAGTPPPLLNEEEEGDDAAAAAAGPAPPSPPATSSSPASSIPDLDDLEIIDAAEADEAPDPAALPPPQHKTSAPAPGGPRPNPPSTTAAAAAAADEDDDPHLLRTRTYDLMMTYDKFYQTPRLWLAGYAPDRAPLGCAAVLGDVAAEHARKTVTWDPFPHGPGRAASIHPCRHAAVMKKLASVAAGGGSGSGGGGGGASAAAAALPVDRYLVLFLKFIQAVIPTIEYDFTMAAATAARA